MTKDKNPEPNDPDDLWLQVLRGAQINFRSGSDLKYDESYLKVKEAEILRKKILYKIENEDKFETSSSAYQKILEEAKKRKLLKESKKTWNWFGLTGGGGFSISGGGLVSPTYAIASIVLIVGLITIAGYQTARLNSSQSQVDILRGEKNAQIVLLVEDPKVLVNQIQREFIDKGVDSSITFEPDGSIAVQIPVNSVTIALMLKKRIELPPHKFCTLIIKKSD
jgi:hypothetical protein